MNDVGVLDKFDRLRESRGGWIARCPAHEDRTPSLSIRIENEKVLLHCHAGCTVEAITDAIGIKTSDLFLGNGHTAPKPHTKTKKPNASAESVWAGAQSFDGTEEDVDRMQCELARSRIAQEYIESRGVSLRVASELKWGSTNWKFRNELGQLVEKLALAIPHYRGGKVAGIKFKKIGGAKQFSQLPRSSTDGLYALAHLDPGVNEVLIFEGPEDVAVAISHGFNAVAINAAGARVLDGDLAVLRRHSRIFVIGDQDVAGQRAMNELQQRLPAEKVIRVRLPGFKDVGDLYTDGPAKFVDRLRKILRIARASREYFDPDDLLTENEIQDSLDGVESYVIDKLVPRNAITMVFGEEKGGKSALSFYMGKCTVNGRAVFGKYKASKCPVLYMDLENSDFDIKNFADLFARVGPESVRYRNRATGCPDLTSPGLIRFCERFKPLIIFDSLTKFLRGADPFHPGEMSDLFDKLLNLCAAGATVILIHHATRDDALRYANSHQIGASVARAFAVVSEDRPQLQRVRLECILSRGAEAITEHLVGFPVIAERGEFGLSTDCDPFSPELEALLEFVRSQPGEACSRETIKRRLGKRAAANLKLLDLAIKRGLLEVQEDRKVAFPNSGTHHVGNLTFPSVGTDGNQP